MIPDQPATVTHAPHKPGLAVLSLLVSFSMFVAMFIGITVGVFHPWKGAVAMLILAAVPVCTFGTALALIALIWRKESKPLCQYALWTNGLLGFFSFPILCFWVIWR
jgi:hypothetical protein